MAFPKGFVWGAAAASYQVEGGAYADGKGLSVWDMMCRKDGAIWKGQSGDVACDHYRLHAADVALMKQIGLNAYRFSISWPRVIPAGTGKVNAKGLAFYDRLVDELLAAGIAPFVTLFHWDYPYDLYCRGGWLSPDSPDWFAEYTQVVVRKLSDRVQHWMTLNEPQCFIDLGHRTGVHAPGDKLGFAQVLRAGHNALLAHGKAVQAIRAYSKRKALVGYAPVGEVKVPDTKRKKDVDAARKAMFSVKGRHCFNNTWWMDPVFFGRYPEDGLALYGKDVPSFTSKDMDTICQPVDFFGANTYFGARVRAGKRGEAEPVPEPLGARITLMDWPVVPEALYWGPKFFYERYKLPVIITENGVSNMDWPAVDGKVHDPQRIDYLTRYLREFARAGRDGVDIRGYFAWSIMDNFEWALGYKQRFGLVYVDYPTQRRIPKDSAEWYRRVIQTNRAVLDV